MALAVTLLALLVLVALSVRAHYSLGPSGVPNRGPGAAVLGSIVQVLLVVSVAAFELLLVLALIYAPWRRMREVGKGGVRAGPISRVAVLRLMALPVAILLAEAIAFVLLVKRRQPARTRSGASAGKLGQNGHHFVSSVGAVTVPEATALAAAVGLILLAVVLLTRYRSRHGRAGAEVDPSELPHDLTAALDEGLAELAGGGDPRQAVITAYERMERVLAGVGFPAHAYETPLEYLDRALSHLQASRGALLRLTDLFETARFSTHPVGSGMRVEAETALGDLRAELTG
ncbi:MAG: DUF4129 domain-containing protein [Candidatus Dormibacteria bacterium]